MFTIERMDEAADVTRDGEEGSTSNYYGLWRVTEYPGPQPYNKDIWLIHFSTYREAKHEIWTKCYGFTG
jgi:hypothetical protein